MCFELYFLFPLFRQIFVKTFHAICKNISKSICSFEHKSFLRLFALCWKFGSARTGASGKRTFLSVGTFAGKLECEMWGMTAVRCDRHSHRRFHVRVDGGARRFGSPGLLGFIARNAKFEAERIGACRLRNMSYLWRKRHDDGGGWIPLTEDVLCPLTTSSASVDFRSCSANL